MLKRLSSVSARRRVRNPGLFVALGLFCLGAEFSVTAADFYVSPTGTTSTAVGTGTVTNPWALQTALSQPAAVRPGDTIWLRGGTYKGNFTSYLTGTVSQPIVVRQYPGERATLDGNVNPSQSGSSVPVLTHSSGGYTWYWGLEVTNSSPVRTDSYPCTNCRGDGIWLAAPGLKVINGVIHDTGQGISNWAPATNAEVYGNLVYYNGWWGSDGMGHGHGMYAQNPAGSSKLMKHNLFFSQLGDFNFQAYGSSSSSFVNSRFEENVWFRASLLGGGRQYGHALMGGRTDFALTNSQMIRNYSWDDTTEVGYYSQDCNGVVVTNNYFVDLLTSSVFTPPLAGTGQWAEINVSSNVFVGGLDGFQQSNFPNNTYYSISSPPTTNKVVVLPNAYEAGRATIIVYNWAGSATQAVDLTGVVGAGVAYEIRDAQNYYGPLVASGTYTGGTITLPMAARTPATPVGYVAPPPTGPAFNTFIVLPRGGTSVVTRVLPVVVDVEGLNGVHVSTEVTLCNRGVTPASLSLTYTASPQFGGTSGTVTEELPPGRQLLIPDAISYLRNHGLSLGGGNQVGTLRVTFAGLTSVEASYAAARIIFPSGSGRAGTAFASVRPEDGCDGKAIVFGLRENDRERSNVALVNLASSGSITLALTAFSGGADARTATLNSVTLGPGEWVQVNSPLVAAGFDNGFISVERIAGTGRFFTYGVVNDNRTNDGAFIPPVLAGAAPEDQILPVIVENGTFDSDLVLANISDRPVTAALTYEDSLGSQGSSTPFKTDIALGGREQLLIPSAVEFLRQRGLGVGPRGTASYAGPVNVLFSQDGVPAQGYAGALIATPAPHGGRYGLYFNGVPDSRAAAGDAWVFGLEQDDTSRSNLAVASAGNAGESVTCRLEVYDGYTGRLAGEIGPFVLPTRGWIQFPSVLTGFGVSNGYVRVVGTTGADRFVVYGVVNDGSTPTSGRTNDGSFIPSPTD